MFWTMPENHGLPEVTLCEEHALEATNIASVAFVGVGPFPTMEEAAIILEALTAAYGGSARGFGFISSEEGVCEDCPVRVEESA